ncbi:hypothetical protein C8Q80DRAFT_1138876 [Daedaleopsis nitida]|nr:hypothetical protein C8Q80DRAFT_1138876 [Daedaleopsis nitida]
MPHIRSWAAPPTRREVTLLLLSLTIFVLSYNLETSLGLIGVRPQRLSTSYLAKIGLGTRDPGFDADGRRPAQWRDELEDLIAGDWEWREGEVSGHARSMSSVSGGSAMAYNFGMLRRRKRRIEKGEREVGLSRSMKEQFIKWGKKVPHTKIVAHTPGFTILENVITVNGTLFVVANDWTKVPKLGDIASSSQDPSRSPRVQDWHMLTANDASAWFGPYAAKPISPPFPFPNTHLPHVHHPFILFYHSRGLHIISPSSPALSANTVPAPLRLIFPHVPTFSTPHIPPNPDGDVKAHPPPRDRAFLGIHPLLPKVVLPTLGMWFEEDWQDLADMHVPFMLERVVVVDRGAAERGRADWRPSSPDVDVSKRAPSEEGEPVWAAPFVGLDAPDRWWAPMRTALLRYLRIDDGSSLSGSSAGESRGLGSLWGKKKEVRRPIVSYVSMQEQPMGMGPRLSGDDHERLVDGLRKLESEGVVEVHVMNGNGTVPALDWTERMSAIARSTIVIGASGHHLADAIFMRSPLAESSVASSADEEASRPLPPMLMEFFPPGTFVRDQQFAMQVLGIDYIAWWNDMKFTKDNLPAVTVTSPTSWDAHIPINVEAVLHTIREEAPRRVA